MQKSKKVWLLVPVAVAIIAIGGVGAVAVRDAAAQESTTNATTSVGDFASRVAAILGIESDKVQSAMDQARKDVRDEAVQKKLDAMVQAGKLTQAQADEYLSWYKARPADMPGFMGPGFGGHGKGRAFGHHGMGPGSEHWQMPAPSQAQPQQDSSS
ncbi:MAG: hypothetical protein FJ316_01625 [SAR202 cluster bacterium]|nr:hypothetical protein [SAR202 cluster bacterium]